MSERGGATFESPWVRLRSGSRGPFIYRRMVKTADREARPGDAVAVYDKSGRFYGRGLFNPRSQIALRMLVRDATKIDDDFWAGRIGRAVELRRRLRLDEVTDAYRLVHGEGDGLSGLVVERLGDCLVIEHHALGMYLRRDRIAAALAAALGAPARLDRPDLAAATWSVVNRAPGHVEAHEGFRVEPPRDAAPRHLVVREHCVRYRVDPAGGHKTGFFCDQRENRLRFARLCRGARVLDLCCHVGGFALCARLAGGAREATALELDEDALALARENANLNQTRVEFVHADAFPWLRQAIANGRTFDAVVLDPPRLAASREELHAALRKYTDLNALALGVVAPGGFLLTCSCSGLVSPAAFDQAVFAAARAAGRTVQVLDRTGAAPDHPVMMDCPESAYLKALWLRVLRPDET